MGRNDRVASDLEKLEILILRQKVMGISVNFVKQVSKIYF